MTPREKADELYSKFYYTIPIDEMNKDEEAAKQCAIISVDEIIKEHYPQDVARCQYWREVKQEIEKL